VRGQNPQLATLGLTQTIVATAFFRPKTRVSTAKHCVKHGEHCVKYSLCVSPDGKTTGGSAALTSIRHSLFLTGALVGHSEVGVAGYFQVECCFDAVFIDD
jgi:hypothetical protein